MKVAIIGAGNMGPAMALHCGRKGYHVSLFTVEKDVFEQISKTRENKKYLPGFKLRKNISVTMDYSVALKDAKLVFVTVPSFVVDKVVKSMSSFIEKDAIIVNLAKGFGRKGEFLTDIYLKNLPKKLHKNFVLMSGPAIANEIAKGETTAMVVAGNEKTVSFVINKISEKNFILIKAKDRNAVEFGGFYKNIVALGTGMCDGLNMGDNLKAIVVTYGLKEAKELAAKIKVDAKELDSLVGLGDIYVTCSSLHSRNRRCGELLGRGNSFSKTKCCLPDNRRSCCF
ncbi:MAG: NAD(P)-binding domain-containing protein [Candidatus Woesearchaeota archaeon]